MKKSNKKLLTLILASALCATSFGVGLATLPSLSAEETTTNTTAVKSFTPTEIFYANGGTIGVAKIESSDQKETVKFSFDTENETTEQSISFNRNLALKWYDNAEAKYLTLEFALADMNFKEISFKFQSESSMAANDGVAENTVKFVKKSENTVDVFVYNGEAENKKTENVSVTVGVALKLSLTQGAEVDQYDVKLGDDEIGTFTNIGVEYAEYVEKKMIPLTISAIKEAATQEETTEETDITSIYMISLNGQAFNNVEEVGGKKKVLDTTPPVLVVTEDIEDAFLLGTSFSFGYKTIDVLPTSIDEKKTYYQYNPADEKANYKAVISSPYFMDTVYYVGADGEAYKTAEDAGEGYKTTSVFKEEKAEYVSYKMTLADGTYKVGDETNPAKEYELAWYVGDKAKYSIDRNYEVTSKDENGVETTTTETEKISYVIFNREQSGPQYKYIVLDKDKKRNLYVKKDAPTETTDKYEESELKDWLEGDGANSGYQDLLDAVAASETTKAGSNSYIYLPHFRDFITDTNGYSNMKFTISYKTPSSDTAKSSPNLSSGDLKIATTEEGLYEFKIFAVDKAGNAMKYYVDGELEEVTTANVWEIEEIPSFTFEVQNRGLSIKKENASDRRDTELIGDTYKFSDATVIGASAKKSAYALYKVDFNKYNAGKSSTEYIKSSDLTAISYATINDKIKNQIPADGDYFALYIRVCAELIAPAGATEETIELIESCFERIEEYNSKITESDAEWEAYNKYEWNPSNKSFKVYEGDYLVVADYWESELKHQRAMAYTLVTADSERVSTPGESNWLKNNVVSVVLFSIAGVMLVMIIVLLLIKPSDEKLEEVEENDAKAKAKNKKKKEE